MSALFSKIFSNSGGGTFNPPQDAENAPLYSAPRSFFKDFILGRPAQIQKIPTLTRPQFGVLNSLLAGAPDAIRSSYDYIKNILSDDPNAFAQFEAPIRREFENQTLPAIMDRVGSTAGLRSSALGQQIGQGVSDLETNLAAQRASLKQNAMQNLQNFIAQGMVPTGQLMKSPEKMNILNAAADLFGRFIGSGGWRTPQRREIEE